METLKKGSKGEDVKTLQKMLGLAVDGVFGSITEKAVKNYQYESGLIPDGIVGPKTWASLLASTDISENTSEVEELIIEQYHLKKGEFLDGPTKKEFLFLHHTAGGNNPYAVVDMWSRDSRGKIATEFVLGGQSVLNGNLTYDGKLIQCMPTGAYGWHLGENGSQYMHSHSVGIEVCNFGPIKNGKTYTGATAIPTQIVELAQAFRGSKTWHRYSDKQLSVLKSWILFIAERDNIDVRKGLVEEIKKKGAAGFEWNENAFYGKVKGMWTHTNTRKDKSDMFPQQELIDMLLSL